MQKLLYLVILPVIVISCAPVTQPETNKPTASATLVSPTLTTTPTVTSSPTSTQTPAPTLTPTITHTPSITPTPTFTFPAVVVSVAQAHCRYGPHKAYLHAADLYKGDTGTVRSRWHLSNWLLVKFDKLGYFCWVSPSVVSVTGDVSTVIALNELNLQRIGYNIYGAPKHVSAARNGDTVTITWSQVSMTLDDDRGYLLELFVCQDGHLLWWPVSIPNQYTTSYTVKDQAGCSAPSRGVILTVEKHGFSEPAAISWPQP